MKQVASLVGADRKDLGCSLAAEAEGKEAHKLDLSAILPQVEGLARPIDVVARHILACPKYINKEDFVWMAKAVDAGTSCFSAQTLNQAWNAALAEVARSNAENIDIIVGRDKRGQVVGLDECIIDIHAFRSLYQENNRLQTANRMGPKCCETWQAAFDYAADQAHEKAKEILHSV